MIKVFQYLAVILLLVLVVLAFARSQNALYKPYRRIKLGDHPLWEFLAVDEMRRHLFVSHQLKLLVIHIDTDETVAALDFPRAVYGIALALPLNKGFVSHRSENAVSVFDLQTLQIIGRIEGAGAQPENLLYDAHSNRLFTCNSKGRSLTVIDPVLQTVLTTIPLPGQPALAACDGQGNLFVSLSNSDALLQIDTGTCQLVKHWTPYPGEPPGGLAFDSDNNLLFCVYDGQMIVAEAATHTQLAIVPVGNHPGAVVYDPATSLIYVANGEGNVTILKQGQPDEYKVIQKLSTQTNCRSMVLDPLTKKIYLPALQYQSARKPLPNSFELLVFGL